MENNDKTKKMTMVDPPGPPGGGGRRTLKDTSRPLKHKLTPISNTLRKKYHSNLSPPLHAASMSQPKDTKSKQELPYSMAAAIHCMLRESQKTQDRTMITARSARQTVLLLLLIVSTAASSSVQSEQRSLVQTGNTINDTYAKNSEGHTFRTALFGCVAAVGTLAGLLFLVDKEVSAQDMASHFVFSEMFSTGELIHLKYNHFWL